MKKICRTLKLRKFKTEITKEIWDSLSSSEKSYYILYADGTYELAWGEYDVIKALEKDHIREVKYIFDASDKIMVDRDIIINTDEIK